MWTALRGLVPSFAAAVLGGLVVYLLGGHAPVQEPGLATTHGVAGLAALPARQTAPVSQLPAAARLRLGGFVEPQATIRLNAQAPGRVTYIAGQEGDAMAAGQLIVALDDDALRPEYRAAWAGLAGQMSDSQNAQTQLYHNLYGNPVSPLGGPGYDAYDRMSVPFYNMAQSLFGQMIPGLGGAGSPFGSSGPMMTQSQSRRSWPALNNYRADYERSLAALTTAQSRIDGLDAQLRTRRSYAPSAGVILHKYVRAGDVVQPGQPLVDIADAGQLDFRIEVPVSLVVNLKLGDMVPLSLNSQNLWAQVAQIFPAADGAQRTVTVKLALPPGTAAAPGMYGVAWLAQPGGGSPSSLSPGVPLRAVSYRGSLPVAFVVNADGSTDMRILRLGDTQGDSVAVLSGLVAGEQVLLDPPPTLQAGAPQTGQP
jgi:multidrug efflux pump subunit AcrA (membrane-fusion protein)